MIDLIYFYTFVSVKFVQKDNGKDLALLHGYTFYCHKILSRSTIWSCTRGTGRCKARLILTRDDYTISKANLEHTHKAPNYIIRDGCYFKIWLHLYIVDICSKRTAVVSAYPDEKIIMRMGIKELTVALTHLMFGDTAVRVVHYAVLRIM